MRSEAKTPVAEPCTLMANCCKRLIRSFDSYAAEILSEAMSTNTLGIALVVPHGGDAVDATKSVVERGLFC